MTWFADADGDGFGAASQAPEACDQPSGHVADDTSADVHPDADELCSTPDIDDDCDGALNEDDAADVRTWYLDADGDGHGGPDGVASCAPLEGGTEESTDCDDTDATVFPGATEICDGQQNDCSSDWTSDAGLAEFVDADGLRTDVASTLTDDITWTEPGTLHICDGTWTALWSLDADMSIQGHGDTVLSADGEGTVVHIASDELAVELHDVVLADSAPNGSTGNDPWWGGSGGGLQCFVDSEILLDGVTLRANTSPNRGAGISTRGCSVTWLDGAVESTSEDTDETQVSIEAGSFTLSGGEFADFSAYDGFLMARGDAELVIEDVHFHDVCASIAVSGSTFEDGVTGHYGVVNTYDDGCAATIDDSTFSRLTGDVLIGAAEGGTFSVTNSTLTDSVVDGDGAILGDEADAITVSGCTFTGNCDDYALIYTYSAEVLIQDCEFTDNAMTGYAAIAPIGDATVDSCTFTDNSASAGASYTLGEDAVIECDADYCFVD
ncbi:MAG: hypothetical protein GY913_10610 [Proteobacteria bacterium]|nr:hypothetical protein [Pseudomonadota bacterium]